MIRILLVDDSPRDIEWLKGIIEREPDMTVIGIAKNGKEAIELNQALNPDIITMDIQMPVMDGLEAIRHIMSHHPTPIVVISVIGPESKESMHHIFDAGALAALEKPANINTPLFNESCKKIIATLRSMSEIKVARKRFNITKKNVKPIMTSHPSKNHHRIFEIIAIGVSVGGPIAMKTILSKLPANFPIPIVVVQHMSHGFISGYADWLSSFTPLRVKDAGQFELLKKGTVYIAPDKHHLEIQRVHGKLHTRLIQGNTVDGFYPSITVLLKSVAKTCEEKAIGILLTGMGHDGAQGLLDIKNAHGHTIIQDPESAVVFGMAGVAQSMGAVDRVIKLDNIANYLIEILN